MKIASYKNRNTKILVNNVCGSQWARDEPTTYVVYAWLFLQYGALIKWHLGHMVKAVFSSILVPFIELVLPLSREETCQGNLIKIHC